MKIAIQTGLVDFGNGLIVDPRELLEEFDKKVPRELISGIGKTKKFTIYDFDNMYVSGIDMIINLSIWFENNGKIHEATFYKTLTPEEVEKGYTWYATVYEEEYEKYRDILRKLLNIPNFTKSVKFSWGTVEATLDNGHFDTDITIRYEEETGYERALSRYKQAEEELREGLNQYNASLEQYKQYNPDLSDLQGQNMKQEEYERLSKWNNHLNRWEKNIKLRGKELKEMFKAFDAQRENG